MISLVLGLLACAGGVEFEDPPEPDFTYVYGGDDLADSSRGSRITAQALQGLLNRDEPRMFLDVNHGETHDEDWLAALITGTGLRHRAQGDLLWYLWAWADELEGYVLFDSNEPATASVALVVGATRGAVPVDVHNARIHQYVVELGLDQIADVRTWSDEDLRASGHVDRLDLTGLVLKQPFAGTERFPGDLAASRALPVTWVDPRDDLHLTDLHGWLDLLEPGAEVYGEGYTDALYDHDTWVGPASAAGAAVVPTGTANNLSLYAVLDSEVQASPELPALPEPASAHRVALVVGGGEDVGAVLDRITHPARGLWAHPSRGALPLGWTLPPALARLAPPVLHHLYSQATQDDAVVAAVGLVDPEVHPDLGAWAQVVAAGAADLGAGVIALPAASPASLEVLLAPDAVRGALLLEGESTWAASKPALSVDLLGFEGDPAEELEPLALSLAARPADGGSLEGYSVVYACQKTTTVDDLMALAEALEGDVELVRVDVLVELALRDALP